MCVVQTRVVTAGHLRLGIELWLMGADPCEDRLVWGSCVVCGVRGNCGA